MTDVVTAPVPRVALKREEAAASLAMSVDSFARYVQPHLKVLRLGKIVLIPIAELQRFADEFSERECPRICVGTNERDVHVFNPRDFRCSSEGL